MPPVLACYTYYRVLPFFKPFAALSMLLMTVLILGWFLPLPPSSFFRTASQPSRSQELVADRYRRDPLPAGILREETTPTVGAEKSASTEALPHKDLKRSGIEAAYGELPISFERNQGQTNSSVKFFGRGEGYGVFLTEKEAVLALRGPHGAPTARDGRSKLDAPGKNARVNVLRLKLRGSNRKPRVTGVQELTGSTNYLLGRHDRNWILNAKTYAKVRYENVYDGIDLVYYGNARQLECDFLVAPQADPGVIKLAITGRQKLFIDDHADLSMQTSGGRVLLHAPIAYQIIVGVRHEVASRFVLGSGGEITFRLASYDKRAALTIDPVLTYSTYLGGSGHSAAEDEAANGVAVDAAGNAYVVGSTVSTDFPVVNAYKPNGGGFADAFISKLNPLGTALVYSTYLGGNRTDQGLGIAVDANGSAYVTGVSSSTDFPTTPGAFQTTGLDTDVFVTKLNPAGNGLVYSTLLSGDRTVSPTLSLSSAETGFAIAVDSQGNAYVTGETQSSNFPGANTGVQPSGGGGFDAFVTKLNASGSGLIFSTYLGGSDQDGAKGIALDSLGAAYVVGETSSLNFPTTPGAYKTTRTFSNVPIGFVTKLSPAGAMNYSTYLGDTFDRARAVAVDAIGNAFVAGETNSRNFPTTPTALKTKLSDGAVFKTGDRAATWSSTGSMGEFAVNSVALDGNSANLYAGTQGGLFRSNDGGNSWILVGLSGMVVNSVAVDPNDPATIFAGTNGQGIFKSTNNGTSWTNPVTSVNVFTLTFHPQSSSNVYAGIQGGGLQSTDGGNNWSAFGSGGTTRAIAFTPGDASTIYLATSTGVIKSVDGGSNWTNVLAMSSTFGALVIDPSNPSIVYAAHRLLGIFKTTNAGQSWNPMNSSIATQRVVSLAIDASTNPSTVYAGLDDAGVNKTADGGANWVPTGLTYSVVNSLVIDGASPTNFYAGSLLYNYADAFLTELNSSGSALLYSTYLGGSGYDSGFGLALDANGDPVVAGYGLSVDFPLVNPVKQKNGSAVDAFVLKLKMTTGSISFSSYLGGGGIDRATSVAVDSNGNIYLVGHTRSNDFPTVSALQPNLNFVYDAFVTKITSGTPAIQFSTSNTGVNEGSVRVEITVNRTGDTSIPSSVDYATSDLSGANNCNVLNGAASSRCDYLTTVGTFHFAANETSRLVSVPIIDDAYAEGGETFNITLSHPSGATLGPNSSTTVTIDDNEATNGANPINLANFFVRQHYLDFLNREPDPSGLAFWSNQITECEQPGATCNAEVRRINVSAAFFLSIEFQETGYLVYRFYKSAYGDIPGTPVPIRLIEFLPDTQQIGKDVVIGQPGADLQLEANKVAYALDFVSRSRFTSAYPTTLTPAQFVDALFTNAGVTPTATDRTGAINEFGVAGNTTDTAARARALRRVAENSTLKEQETNKAFVLMQYFGYLRRNPNDPPEAGLNFDGYNFWLGKLNEFNGNFVNAEMVKAFIVSGEYRHRFGP